MCRGGRGSRGRGKKPLNSSGNYIGARDPGGGGIGAADARAQVIHCHKIALHLYVVQPQYEMFHNRGGVAVVMWVRSLYLCEGASEQSSLKKIYEVRSILNKFHSCYWTMYAAQSWALTQGGYHDPGKAEDTSLLHLLMTPCHFKAKGRRCCVKGATLRGQKQRSGLSCQHFSLKKSCIGVW